MIGVGRRFPARRTSRPIRTSVGSLVGLERGRWGLEIRWSGDLRKPWVRLPWVENRSRRCPEGSSVSPSLRLGKPRAAVPSLFCGNDLQSPTCRKRLRAAPACGLRGLASPIVAKQLSSRFSGQASRCAVGGKIMDRNSATPDLPSNAHRPAGRSGGAGGHQPRRGVLQRGRQRPRGDGGLGGTSDRRRTGCTATIGTRPCCWLGGSRRGPSSTTCSARTTPVRAGRQMTGFFSDPSLNVLCMATPVANNALQAVGVAAAVKDGPQRRWSTAGSATARRSKASSWKPAPRPCGGRCRSCSWCRTTAGPSPRRRKGRTFYSLPSGPADQLFGMPIHFVDGRDRGDGCTRSSATWWPRCGGRAEPAVVVLQVERLTSHTNADDQTIYREREDIDRVAADGGSDSEFRAVAAGARLVAGRVGAACGARWSEEVAAAEEAAALGPDPEPVFHAKRPLTVELTHPSRERRGSGEGLQLIMRDALARGVARPPAERPAGDAVRRGHRGPEGRRVRRDQGAEHRVPGAGAATRR